MYGVCSGVVRVLTIEESTDPEGKPVRVKTGSNKPVQFLNKGDRVSHQHGFATILFVVWTCIKHQSQCIYGFGDAAYLTPNTLMLTGKGWIPAKKVKGRQARTSSETAYHWIYTIVFEEDVNSFYLVLNKEKQFLVATIGFQNDETPFLCNRDAFLSELRAIDPKGFDEGRIYISENHEWRYENNRIVGVSKCSNKRKSSDDPEIQPKTPRAVSPPEETETI